MVDRLLTQKEQPHLDTEQMAERRNTSSLSGDDRVDWDVRQASKSPSVQTISKCSHMRSTKQGKGVPQFLLHLKTRQRNTLDLTVQQYLEWLSLNWRTQFSSTSSSSWSQNSTWWHSQHWENPQQWREWHPEEWQDQKWWDKW